ncbi:MAG TPA: MFS transporter, partial [Actinopolymorphaceae bacterium]|nr:MFS transporter [Actinopolymorphaceae bacterium]
VPADLTSKAQVELTGGVPFIATDDLAQALDAAGVSGATAAAIIDENERARLDGLRAALAVLALIALVALPFSRNIPTRQPG